jgi:hypothetical protein
MEFQEAVRVCFAKYFDFEGEASRPEFWWFFLFVWRREFRLRRCQQQAERRFLARRLVAVSCGRCAPAARHQSKRMVAVDLVPASGGPHHPGIPARAGGRDAADTMQSASK